MRAEARGQTRRRRACAPAVARAELAVEAAADVASRARDRYPGLLGHDDALEQVLRMRVRRRARRPAARAGPRARRRSRCGPATATRAGGRGTGGSSRTSSLSSADTSHVATDCDRHGDRRRDRRASPGNLSRTTSVPAARSPSRWSCSVDDDADRRRRRRARAGSRRCAGCCGWRSRGSRPARRASPTTRMPAASLPIVRPPFNTSNGTSYAKMHEEDSTTVTTARTIPGRRRDDRPRREREDDEQLDHGVEETGDEA